MVNYAVIQTETEQNNHYLVSNVGTENNTKTPEEKHYKENNGEKEYLK